MEVSKQLVILLKLLVNQLFEMKVMFENISGSKMDSDTTNNSFLGVNEATDYW